MILKRSDVMRRMLDEARDDQDKLFPMLDQLEDPAFWAWWQENEKERHMRADRWTTNEHGYWYAPAGPKSPTNTTGGLRLQRAWEIFRIDFGVKTALPMLPIMLAFDPAKQEGLKEILDNPTAWTLWLLWKARHIVSQHFNVQCLRVAEVIDNREPKTPAELKSCFPTFGQHDLIRGNDVDKFCEEAVPFFTGEKEVEIVIYEPECSICRRHHGPEIKHPCE
jgi:hypothetical protein